MGSSSTPGTRKSTKPTRRTAKRYRINPLELLIFSLVTAGFSFSVYHLFRDGDGVHFATLQPMQIQPTRTVGALRGAARGIAGTVDGVAPVAHTISFEVNCAENPGFQFGNQVCPSEPTPGRTLPDSAKYNPAKIR